MEGVIAKRCLREGSLNRNYHKKHTSLSRKENINSVYRKNLYINRKINREENNSKPFFDKIIFNIKMKLWIQAITAMCLMIVVIFCSMLNIKTIDNNKYVKIIKKEYNKNYPLNSIKREMKKLLEYSYSGILKIVPDRIENNLKSMYKDVRQKFKEEKIVNNLTIYEETKEKSQGESNENVKNLGIGVSIEEEKEEAKYEEAVSTISSQDTYLQYIKDNNIKFVTPTKGSVTSGFGAREEIFLDIDSYHTGVDIANKKGTDIVASLDGKVTKVSNNKYNGNFVEITSGRIVTKYAHMDSVSVKQNVNIKAGEKIGKMGETGYATGPHLHFEVVVDGVKIDPSKVLEIKK